MQEKINQKGFIPIPLLIGITLSLLAVSGITYGTIEYNKTSKIIKEAEQLSKEEKYNEAIEKLEVAQNKLLGKIILKQKIGTELESNKKFLEDKSEYTQGLEKFEKKNWEQAKELLSKVSEDFPHYQEAKNKIEEAQNNITKRQITEAVEKATEGIETTTPSSNTIPKPPVSTPTPAYTPPSSGSQIYSDFTLTIKKKTYSDRTVVLNDRIAIYSNLSVPFFSYREIYLTKIIIQPLLNANYKMEPTINFPLSLNNDLENVTLSLEPEGEKLIWKGKTRLYPESYNQEFYIPFRIWGESTCVDYLLTSFEAWDNSTNKPVLINGIFPIKSELVCAY